jgi:Integrase zinc binding domain
LPLLFLHNDFASRHLHIQLLRNDYTVSTRCRHRGGIVDPLASKACRAIRQPNQPIRSDTGSLDPKYSKTSQFSVIKRRFIGIESHASESYYHSYTVATSGVHRFVSQICHNRLFRKKFQQNILRMVSTEVSSLVAHNTEKEGFSIVDTVTKVKYLLLSHDEFSILSDHINPTFIYNPLSADPTLARYVVHKFQRWALKMSVFSYRMEHVMGELNYWTDLMTRWGVGWVAGSENNAHGKRASLFAQPYIGPPDNDTVKFPSKRDILLVQTSAVNENERCQQGNAMARQEVPPQQVDAGGMRMMNNALWIPERAVELQLRLCVKAHCRSARHREYEATLGAIKEYVAWTTMAKDVKVFVQNCLPCIATITGDKVPRPLGTQLHATKPHEILHLDFPVHRVVKRREVSVLATPQG